MYEFFSGTFSIIFVERDSTCKAFHLDIVPIYIYTSIYLFRFYMHKYINTISAKNYSKLH